MLNALRCHADAVNEGLLLLEWRPLDYVDLNDRIADYIRHRPLHYRKQAEKWRAIAAAECNHLELNTDEYRQWCNYYGNLDAEGRAEMWFARLIKIGKAKPEDAEPLPRQEMEKLEDLLSGALGPAIALSPQLVHRN